MAYQIELENWKLSIAQSIINTIASAGAAFANAFATLPNPIAAAIVGATTAGIATAFGTVTTRQIRKNKPQPPSFDVGSFDVPSDTLAQVHQGEIIVPKKFADSVREGDAVISVGDRSGGVGKMTNLTVNIDGKQFFKLIFDATKSGELKLSEGALVTT